MSAAAARQAKADREGVLAVVQDHPTRDLLQSLMREHHQKDELIFEDTPDTALRRVRAGLLPRVLVMDVTESATPIADISAARTVGGPELKLVALGLANDVGFFRDLLQAGANDYLVRPPSRDALVAALDTKSAGNGPAGDNAGLGRVVVFLGNRGGVGTTTAAVSCAWLLAEEHQEKTALLDLDLHFGTVALALDMDPGHGLCEALEQPSRIDSLFIERVTMKATENLRILSAEEAAGQTLMVDAGAIDVLLYELRRKFAWVVVDLPRGASPLHRVALSVATHVVVLCERSLAGLRDSIRLQTVVRDQATHGKLLMLEAGAPGERASVGKSEFEKSLGRPLDGTVAYDAKGASSATNAGQPLPVAAAKSPVLKDLRGLIGMLGVASAQPKAKRKPFALRSLW